MGKGCYWLLVVKGQGCEVSCDRQTTLTLWQSVLCPTALLKASSDIHVGKTLLIIAQAPNLTLLLVHTHKFLFSRCQCILGFPSVPLCTVRGNNELGCVQDKVETYVPHDNALNRGLICQPHPAVSISSCSIHRNSPWMRLFLTPSLSCFSSIPQCCLCVLCVWRSVGYVFYKL